MKTLRLTSLKMIVCFIMFILFFFVYENIYAEIIASIINNLNSQKSIQINQNIQIYNDNQNYKQTNTFNIKIGDYEERLPFYNLPSGKGKFVYFNLANNSRLTVAGAKAIAQILSRENDTIFVTPEASTIGLAHELRSKYGLEGFVISKKVRADMDQKSVIFEEYQPITANKPTRLFLSENEAKKIKNKNVIIIDNVCTTGETIKALYHLIKRSGGNPIYAIVLFTESEGQTFTELNINDENKIKIVSFGHLPIIK